jgi:hypothetical protein
MFESYTSRVTVESLTPNLISMLTIVGQEDTSKAVDGFELFDTELYVSGVHSGHGGGKALLFKRYLFSDYIGAANIAAILMASVEARPSPLCYLHLLQGEEAVGDVATDATAFGCRDWEFACVITCIWPCDQDRSDAACAVVRWVHNVVGDLLPLSTGV